MNAAYRHLLTCVAQYNGQTYESKVPVPESRATPQRQRIIPPDRNNYLRDIVRTVRDYHITVEDQANIAHLCQSLEETIAALPDIDATTIHSKLQDLRTQLMPDFQRQLTGWDALIEQYTQDEYVYTVRGKDIRQPMYHTSLSGSKVARVAIPKLQGHGDRLRFIGKENVPGKFPFTAGVFPLKKKGEEPKRMFAGEGGPARTNDRFHFLCKGESVHRLSSF